VNVHDHECTMYMVMNAQVYKCTYMVMNLYDYEYT